ncbi:SCO2525 family SAM-dependent methyltransferase [Catenuloplanes sp. NPDC051500]|uniref:SCO2525 family SAM-dependent methyltransferase n=1 Tax=Catenuloplanes sp. NPDC051500 TaxID=3363959 RepID=UPI0037927424
MTQILPIGAGGGAEPAGMGLSHGGANDNYPWDDFDPDAYFIHNYRQLRDDDRDILGKVRDFFADADISPRSRGIDVGSGANLYPALCMLPFCERITLYEWSRGNIKWLRKQLRRHGPAWEQYWRHLIESPAYGAVDDPWTDLQHKARVTRGSVFEMSERALDMGTMFFVAESISKWSHEFESAVGGFLGALRLGAPFAAAFMQNSRGYTVGGINFPAVPITADDVHRCVGEWAKIDSLYEIGKGDKPLRDGYDGMILVTGWRR